MIDIVFKLIMAAMMAFLSIYWIETEQWGWAAVFVFWVIVLVCQAVRDFRRDREIERLRLLVAQEREERRA